MRFGILALAVGALASPVVEIKARTCPPVHLIVARGSAESGYGVSIEIVDRVKSQLPGVTTETVIYPADLFKYEESVRAGFKSVRRTLSAYVQVCPQSKILMMGFSQGAHIIGDTLCGGGGDYVGVNITAIDTKIGDHVVGVLFLGDPRWTPGAPYNHGTAEKEGLFPREPEFNCKRYWSRMASYCDFNDMFCSPGQSLMVHMNYTRRYPDEETNFLVSQAKKYSSVPIAL